MVIIGLFSNPSSQTDVYGTCSSKYERRGAVLLKSRDLKQCQQARLAHFWSHSVALTEDTVSLPLFFFDKDTVETEAF